ncbi:MAG: dienelactone hydrolase family protein [Vulcanimicrobiaceae bacterium]
MNKTHMLEDREVAIDVAGGKLGATVSVPIEATAIIVFAHGSGSSRFSGRNRFVAQRLNAAGFGTFLMDLLTEEEERIDRETAEYRFDIPLLSDRLVQATNCMRHDPMTSQRAVGYFGASTGAAAALIAAAQLGDVVSAIVSRGGRPDLAEPALHLVTAPTLLIVGGNDRPVIAMNRDAQVWLRCHNELAIVPGATHLFEEPGALGKVADLAIDWFKRHCAQRVCV